MWAEAGGIDFDGREKWDKWKECMHLSPEEAKLEFVRVFTTTFLGRVFVVFGKLRAIRFALYLQPRKQICL